MSEERIFLVRHGEAAASWGESRDPGLSELGQRQAVEASLALQTLLDGAQPQLVSSPLQRAQETAAPLAKAMGLPVSVNGAFAEIPSPVPLSERQDWLRAFMRSAWSQREEDLHQWRSNITDGILELPANSVVFSHFLVINTVVGYIQGEDNTLVCWPDNAAIVELARTDSGMKVRDLGRQMKTLIN